MYEPCVCLSIQGSKEVTLGKEIYTYNENQFFISAINLPVFARPIVASKDMPFLGISLHLDMKSVSQIILETSGLIPNTKKTSRGISVNNMSIDTLNAFLRLVNLLETPKDIKVLAPLIKQEIIYRLLTEEHGQTLRQLAVSTSHSHQIARTLYWLKDNYTQPIKVQELANMAGMSISSFHQHFRNLTIMSPLQFQKQLRFHEARRLMLNDEYDAATAALYVGYESPTQFSREYSKTFGSPPLRDIKQLTKEMMN